MTLRGGVPEAARVFVRLLRDRSLPRFRLLGPAFFEKTEPAIRAAVISCASDLMDHSVRLARLSR